MTTIDAGTRVKAGYYLSARSWSLHPVAADGALLPGARGDKYVRVPVLAAFVLAPLLGALFLVFMPVIGFYLTAGAAVRPVTRLAMRVATGFAATVAPGWEPGHAHLTGRRAERHDRADDIEPAEDPLDVLEKEIAALRSTRREAT